MAYQKKGEIYIGKGSWVGAHSTIVLGARMGVGSLLAANSVLNSNVEDGAIYGGVPARFIKK